jgi:hypothetical protein
MTPQWWFLPLVVLVDISWNHLVAVHVVDVLFRPRRRYHHHQQGDLALHNIMLLIISSMTFLPSLMDHTSQNSNESTTTFGDDLEKEILFTTTAANGKSGGMIICISRSEKKKFELVPSRVRSRLAKQQQQQGLDSENLYIYSHGHNKTHNPFFLSPSVIVF